MLHSSIALARAAGSCPEGIERTQAQLLHIHSGDEEVLFTVAEVLEFSGLEDAIWALRAVPDEEIHERDRVGRTFAIECVAHACSTLQGPAEADHVGRILRLAYLCVTGRFSRDRSIRLWRALRGKSSGSYLVRAARATLFPTCVSEAARHAATCSVRAVLQDRRAAEEERLWQADQLRRSLTHVGAAESPDLALPHFSVVARSSKSCNSATTARWSEG